MIGNRAKNRVTGCIGTLHSERMKNWEILGRVVTVTTQDRES
ncbi:MAG: hypothetical protein QXL46_05490 [Nitrososphaerales archaeon]